MRILQACSDVNVSCCGHVAILSYPIVKFLLFHRASSFVIDDGIGQDFTSVCFAVFTLIQSADYDAALAGVLCGRIQTLTSKVLTLSLVRNETSPMPCDNVDRRRPWRACGASSDPREIYFCQYTRRSCKIRCLLPTRRT